MNPYEQIIFASGYGMEGRYPFMLEGGAEALAEISAYLAAKYFFELDIGDIIDELCRLMERLDHEKKRGKDELAKKFPSVARLTRLVNVIHEW